MRKLGLLLLAFCPAGFADGHEAACLKAAHEYFVNVDNRDGAAVGALFTDDAVLALPSETLSGPDEIEARFSRAGGPTLVHHLTSHSIEGAKGSVYVLLHMQATVDDGEIRTTLLSGVYHDEYVMADGECKFKSRRLEPRIVTR